MRALERALRCTEQTRSSEAEVALLRAELEAERLAHSKLQDQLMYMTDERASLRRDGRRAGRQEEISEKASQRFQALLHQQQGSWRLITAAATAAAAAAADHARALPGRR